MASTDVLDARLPQPSVCKKFAVFAERHRAKHSAPRGACVLIFVSVHWGLEGGVYTVLWYGV